MCANTNKADSAESPRRRPRRVHAARVGKIARLPNDIREELNRRLQDGEPGKQLLDWLNGLPKIQEILVAQFGGRPINKQNLSGWRWGGYLDWEADEEHRMWVDRVAERLIQSSLQPQPSGNERTAGQAGVTPVKPSQT
jgi:hypothetical protein